MDRGTHPRALGRIGGRIRGRGGAASRDVRNTQAKNFFVIFVQAEVQRGRTRRRHTRRQGRSSPSLVGTCAAQSLSIPRLVPKKRRQYTRGGQGAKPAAPLPPSVFLCEHIERAMHPSPTAQCRQQSGLIKHYVQIKSIVKSREGGAAAESGSIFLTDGMDSFSRKSEHRCA